MRPVSQNPDVHSDVLELFRGKDDYTVSTGVSVLKAALVALAATWPVAQPFDDLWAEVCRRLDRPRDDASAAALLADQLLKCYAVARRVIAHAHTAFCDRAGPRPLASPLARYQAETGMKITNLRHYTISLSDFDRGCCHCSMATATRLRSWIAWSVPWSRASRDCRASGARPTHRSFVVF